MTFIYTSTLICPACGSKASEVKDSRGSADATYIRRRRLCSNGHRYTTQERVTAGWAAVPPSKRAELYALLIKTTEELKEIEERAYYAEGPP